MLENKYMNSTLQRISHLSQGCLGHSLSESRTAVAGFPRSSSSSSLCVSLATAVAFLCRRLEGSCRLLPQQQQQPLSRLCVVVVVGSFPRQQLCLSDWQNALLSCCFSVELLAIVLASALVSVSCSSLLGYRQLLRPVVCCGCRACPRPLGSTVNTVVLLLFSTGECV